MAKKRNPADTTLRNTRAANKRLAELEARLTELEDVLVKITNWVQAEEGKRSSEVPEK